MLLYAYIAGLRSSGPGQSDPREACEPISWPMVPPRKPAAVSKLTSTTLAFALPLLF